MRVAAGDSDFCMNPCELFRFEIGAGPHLTVARFEGGRVGRKPRKIFDFAVACESGENVIHAEENSAFSEIHQKRNEIAAALLNFGVVALGDPIDTDVHLGAAGRGASNLLTKEEVGAASKSFGSVDGIMVG